MTLLSPRYRRLAALAILLMVLALPVAAVISLSGLYQSNLSEIAERRVEIGHFEAIAHYAPQLDAERARSPETTHAAWFLPDSDPAIAAANLQAKLKGLAQRHNVDVAQARDLKPRARSGLTYIGVGIETSGGAEGIAALLRDIEASVPLLIVGQAQMRSEASSIDPRYEPVVLYLDLEVWGALAGPAASEKQTGGGS